MLDFIVEELAGDTAWRTVLAAYETQASDLKKTNPESDAWIPRLRSVEGVESAELSRVHGRLIALGFLKFEMSAKGMQYQVSALGRESFLRGFSGADNAVENASEGETLEEE